MDDPTSEDGPPRWSERFNDRGYRCWLKIGAALRELVAGVAPFVDRVARTQHGALLAATSAARRRAASQLAVARAEGTNGARTRAEKGYPVSLRVCCCCFRRHCAPPLLSAATSWMRTI